MKLDVLQVVRQVFFRREVQGLAQAVAVHVDGFGSGTGQHGNLFGGQVYS